MHAGPAMGRAGKASLGKVMCKVSHQPNIGGSWEECPRQMDGPSHAKA